MLTTASLQTQLRQMWTTRPRRARRSPVAGVCTGFARRYEVDPTLVRVAFIAATVLGGGGLWVYLAAVLLLPKEPAAGAPQSPRTGPSTAMLVVAGVLALIIGSSIGPSWPGTGLLSVAILLVGWYLLQQRLPEPPAGTSVDSGPLPPTDLGAWRPPVAPWNPAAHLNPGVRAHGGWPPKAQPPGNWPAGGWRPPVDLSKPRAADGHDGTAGETTDDGADADNAATPDSTPADATTGPAAPPAWDPLGVAPFAWDLPDPGAAAAAPAPVKKRSRVTSVTLVLATVTVLALATLSALGLVPMPALFIGAAALAVILIGAIVGLFRHSGLGLIAIAIPLAGVLVIGALVSNATSGLSDAPRGERTLTVSDPAQLQPEYVMQFGSLELDLTAMTLDRDRSVHTRMGMGSTLIRVPEGMPVKVTCSVSMGSTDCPDGADRATAAGAPILTVVADGGMGTVALTRG